MAITKHPALLYRGLSTDTKPTVNVLTNTIFIETDTKRTFLFDGSAWNLPDSFNDGYSWLFYKSGPNYKAKSGFLGYAPTGAISTDADTVWAYIKDNFNPTGDSQVGGIVQFYRGTFDFTDQIVIDNTYGSGNSNTGIIVQGHRMGTLIRFVAPSGSPKDSGFVVNGPVREATIRDLNIEMGDFVTNGIRINSAAGDNLDGLYDNLRIINTTNAGTQTVGVTGQRGIYVVGGASPNTLHFNTFRNIWLRFIDTAIETNVPTITNQNTSFLNFDDIKIWRCLKGLKIGDYAIEHNIEQMYFQDFGTPLADYAISVGKYCRNCSFVNVTGDAVSKDGAATIKLDQAAHFNKFTNIGNTGQHAILDYSGTILNEFVNCTSAGAPNYNSKKKVGIWDGGSDIGGSGLFDNGFVLINTGAGSIDKDHFDVSEGKGVRFTTGAVAGNLVGIRSDVFLTRRANYPLFTAKFKIGQTDTSQRFWLFLTSVKTNPPSSNAYQTATSVMGLCFRSTGSGTTFEWLRNDNSGTPAAPDCLWPDSSTIAISTSRQLFNYVTQLEEGSTNEAHEVWIFGDEENSRWLVCLDRGQVQAFSDADQPASAQNLTVQAVLETTAAAAKSFDLYSMKLEAIR